MAVERVVVCSTGDDLTEYRSATDRAIRALGLTADDTDQPADHAADRAGPSSAVETSAARVRRADVLVLIVAHRYGHVPPGAGRSVVETEYDAARAAGVPVLAFFLDPSQPWPPDQVEWAVRDRLEAFRQRVRGDVVARSFRSPQELATLVSQALHSMLSEGSGGAAPTPDGSGLPASARDAGLPAQLVTDPDVLVEIGTSEDELPMLLDVRRSARIGAVDSAIAVLGTALHQSGVPLPAADLQNLRRRIDQAARDRWTGVGVHDVRMTSGGHRDLFVVPENLGRRFTSVLARLVEGRERAAPGSPTVNGPPDHGAAGAIRARGPGEVTDQGAAGRTADPGPGGPLPSTGGSNRFLAIDPATGSLHCVGYREGKVVEWRPFLFEDAVGLLPSATVDVQPPGSPDNRPLADAGAVFSELYDRAGGADLDRIAVSAERSDVLGIVAKVADAVAKFHGDGTVHGDLKPQNVLLAGSEPVLIDDFSVPAGRPAPGWTPNWSAPEQALGLPVDVTADVYSLGMMAVRVLRGTLAGEVRTYRGLIDLGRDAMELFHDPLVIVSDQVLASGRAQAQWRAFVERALRFSAADRFPDVAEFADGLRTLTESHPPSGRLSFRPTGELLPVRLAGGGVRIGRKLDDV